MASAPPYSVEILGDRFRIVTKNEQNRNLDIFADIMGHIAIGLIINHREELSHEDATEKFKHFNISKIDTRLLEHLENFGGTQDACFAALDAICSGQIRCHELVGGSDVLVEFQDKDGEIDSRIQRLADIRDLLIRSLAAKSKPRKRKARGEVNSEAVKKTPKTSKTSEGPKLRTAGEEILHNLQKSLREISADKPCSLPMPMLTAERDQDDVEQVKPDALAGQPAHDDGHDSTMGGETDSKTESSSIQHTVESREVIEIESDSDDPSDGSPDKGQQSVKNKRDRIVSGTVAKQHQGTSRLPQGNHSDNVSATAKKSLTALGNKAKHVKNEVGVETQSDPVVARNNSIEAPSEPVVTNTTPNGVASKAGHNLDVEPTTGVAVAIKSQTLPPNTNSDIAERIAIKQSKFDIQKLRFELDYEDGDQVKCQRRLDMAVSGLELLQMRYEMQHGEAYDG